MSTKIHKHLFWYGVTGLDQFCCCLSTICYTGKHTHQNYGEIYTCTNIHGMSCENMAT